MRIYYTASSLPCFDQGSMAVMQRIKESQDQRIPFSITFSASSLMLTVPFESSFNIGYYIYSRNRNNSTSPKIPILIPGRGCSGTVHYGHYNEI
jgi:hypothetical protein